MRNCTYCLKIPMLPAITKLFQNNVRFTSLLFSLLLSLWVVYTDDVINIDGILYLQVGAFLQQGNWTAALAYYDWPFYSMLIALASTITGLGLERAADLLDAVLFALTTDKSSIVVGDTAPHAFTPRQAWLKQPPCGIGQIMSLIGVRHSCQLPARQKIILT